MLTDEPMKTFWKAQAWMDNIRMNLKEIGFNTKLWIDSSQDGDYWRVLVIAAINLRVR